MFKLSAKKQYLENGFLQETRFLNLWRSPFVHDKG